MPLDFKQLRPLFGALDATLADRFAGKLARSTPALPAEEALVLAAAVVAEPAATTAAAWPELETIRLALVADATRRRLAVARPIPVPYEVYGSAGIHVSARQQMDDVMRLGPVIAGALMPDAHVGYGMPIGGVAATENAVIPYAVGVDIGCRMHLTVFRQPAVELESLRGRLREALLKGTRFGQDMRPTPLEHPLLDDPRLAVVERRLQKADLRTRAGRQFGTSRAGRGHPGRALAGVAQPLRLPRPGLQHRQLLFGPRQADHPAGARTRATGLVADGYGGRPGLLAGDGGRR